VLFRAVAQRVVTIPYRRCQGSRIRRNLAEGRWETE